MLYICIITSALLTFGTVWGQLRQPPYSWLPDDFPNPQTNPEQCGLGSQPGYICDPNGILTKHQLETLDWFLHGIADTETSRHCPCSQYYCKHGPKPRFYKVAVAILPRMQLPRDTDLREVTPLAQAQKFAYHLKNDRWNFSVCGEDVVVLYSMDDKVLVTMTGHVAAQRLDPYSRTVINKVVGQHFADGLINDGLLRMVHEIRYILMGNSYYPGAERSLSGVLPQSSSSGSLVVIALAFAAFHLCFSPTYCSV